MNIREKKNRGGSKKHQQVVMLQEEVAALRKELNLVREEPNVSVWEKLASQEMRDAFAARALYAERGDVAAALRWLGYKDHDLEEMEALARRIFLTPGVQAFLERTREDVEKNFPQILARLTDIAIHGEDEQAIRAATTLAKITGKTKEANVTFNRTTTIYSLMGGPPASTDPKIVGKATVAALPPGTIDSEEFLCHEPGEAVRIEDTEEVEV